MCYNKMMKSNVTPRVSVIDALTSGLTMVSKRPRLLLVPVAIDLLLWLAPRFSIGNLAQKFLAVWEALVRAAYSPAQLSAMADMVATVREAITQLGAEANLLQAVTGNWLGPTSALIAVQSTRQTFISDILLAPLGLRLNLPQVLPPAWRPAPVEISSPWVALLVLGVCWLVGQLLVAWYYVQCAGSLAAFRPEAAARAGWQAPAPEAEETAETTAGTVPSTDPPDATDAAVHAAEDVNPAPVPIVSGDPPQAGAATRSGLRGFLRLALRLTLFSVLLSLVVSALRVPLGATILLMVVSGGAGAGILFALVGGITLWALLWFLISMYFASEAIAMEGQSVWRGALQSLAMMRGNGLSALGLVLTINVLSLGFRAVWGLIGRSPVGAGVAVLGNAILTTGMLLAIFVYYEEIRRRWQARQALASGGVTSRNLPPKR